MFTSKIKQAHPVMPRPRQLYPSTPTPTTRPTRFFPRTERVLRPRLSAQSALVILTTTFRLAPPDISQGRTSELGAHVRTIACSTPMDATCVSSFKAEAVPTGPPNTHPCTNVRHAAPSLMELRTVLTSVHTKAQTPYPVNVRAQSLEQFSLSSCYPHLVQSLRHGFNAGIPIIRSSFAPPNLPFVYEHYNTFMEIVNDEFSKGRYLVLYHLLMLSLLLDRFNLLHFHWYLSLLLVWTSFVLYRIFLILTLSLMYFLMYIRRLMLLLILTFSLAHGARLRLHRYSFLVYLQVPRWPLGTSMKPTELFLWCQTNGPAPSFKLQKMINLPLIYPTALVFPPPVASGVNWQMHCATLCELGVVLESG